MRHSSCRYRNRPKSKGEQNDVQLYSVFVHSLRGSHLPVWMPERASRAQNLDQNQLSMRECLQMRPAMQMQSRVKERARRVLCPRGVRFAARSNTRRASEPR